jgi:hypothetical protein
MMAKEAHLPKIRAKHGLNDPALKKIEHIIESAVQHLLHNKPPPAGDRLGVMMFGIVALSEGLMLCHRDDSGLIETSMPIYDALYAYFRDRAQDRDDLSPLEALIRFTQRVEQNRNAHL